MSLDDIRIIACTQTSAKRFGYWVRIKDYRRMAGSPARRSLVKFFESSIGPIGERWHYSKYHNGLYDIKFNDQQDLLIFLLKATRD